MQHINVYVEEMASHIPAREMPIADADRVVEALRELDGVDAAYYNEDGTLKVSDEWHKAAVLDFLDWLEAHTPNLSLASMARRLEGIRFIDTLFDYNAEEIADAYRALIQERFSEPTTSEIAQAQVIADSIITINDEPMSISVFTDMGLDDDMPDSFFIPRWVPRAIDDESIFEEDIPRRIGAFNAIAMAALYCLKAHGASLSYTVHDSGTEANMIGMFLFCKGHVGAIDQQDIQAIANAHMDGVVHAGIAENLLANLSSFTSRSEFEMLACAAGAAIVSSLQSSVESSFTYETGVVLGTADEATLNLSLGLVSNVQLVIAENAMGDAKGIPAPTLGKSESLADYFESVLELSPFVSETEATDTMISAVIAQGAAELLLTGGLERVSQKVIDLAQEVELGMSANDFDLEQLYLFDAHASVVADQVQLDISDRMFEELPAERKSELNRLIELITFEKDKSHSIIALEGEIDEERDDMSAVCLSLPPDNPAMPKTIGEDFKKMLKAMILNASRSNDTTLICASRHPMERSVDVSGIKWNNGDWNDLGEDKVRFYLDATNIGSAINLNPGDIIDYRYLK